MADGGWRMADGGWRMADGGWRMADGGWRMADIGYRISDGFEENRTQTPSANSSSIRHLSAIQYPISDIRNLLSAICYPKSAIRHPKSEIRPMNQTSALYRSFGLLLALLLFLVGLSLYNFRLLGQASAYSTRSYQTLIESEALLQSLLNMETGVRGFLVTGEEQFLDPYDQGRTEFATHMAKSTQLMEASPAQIVRLQELERLQQKWVDAMLQPAIATRRDAASMQEGLAAASTRANERKDAMDEMRNVIRRIEDRERTLLNARAQQVQQRRSWFELILWGGGLFSILITAALALFAARAAQQVALAQSRLEAANAQLVNSKAEVEAANAQLIESKAEVEAENEQRRAAEEKLEGAVQDLKRSNAELEQFAYVASHDLQEPLRAVAGCVQVLQKRYGGKLDARADQFIEHAVDGAQRMQNLINDLLAYSRVGTHGKPFEAIALDKVADFALQNLSERIKETGVEVTRDALPDVWGDSGQLELVLQNLVSNALKFRGPHEPQVHIGYELRRVERALGDEGQSETSDEPQHVISVRDNGLGIEPQYFERIFVMFQRLHTRTEFPGTGIGLAICKKIVERHGGTIGVQSAAGEGATFWFSLPQVAASEAEETQKSEAVAA